jgi:lipase maturation factor 1
MPTHSLARWVFLRALGAVYLVAFLSLWVQIAGLVGSRGILPAATLLDWIGAKTGPERFRLLPTLFWLHPTDGFLHFLCGGGVALALLLIFGIAPLPVLVLLWVFYLSLVTVGQDFLGFQWDGLLLETGLLAVFLAPPGLRPRIATEAPVPPLALWILRFLLFRLMFTSGAVKLKSGDPAWRGLTALRVHYETQPLPPWMGWLAHQLPARLHTASTAVMFAIELLVPFLIFGPRPLRLTACALMVALQAAIAATGNYGFFNLLSVVLCLLLLDDGVFPARWREAMGTPAADAAWTSWSNWAVVPLAVVVAVTSTIQIAGAVGLQVRWPRPMVTLYRALSPLRTFNPYGLFAVMTPSRPEIVIEGSRDGTTWQAYEFRWKPGDLRRRPAFMAPHMPRLDWQMWFAALGSCEDSPWFQDFLGRLLQGSPPVVRLLAHNPFPDAPPRYIRSTVYDYRFTDMKTLRADGTWWRRTRLGPFCPTVTAAPAAP